MQKGSSWLFPRGFDDPEADAAAAADEPAVPYSPSPLRFLRRNKTVPVTGSASGGLGCALPAGSVHMAATGWGSLRVAGGVGRVAAVHAEAQAAFPAGGATAPLPLFSPVGAATSLTAQQGQQQRGHVARNHTWPVYQNPLAMLPPCEHSGGSLAPGSLHPLAAAVQPLPLPAANGPAAGEVPGAARPGSPHSQSSTPHDSAQDLEAGRSPEALPGEQAWHCGSASGKLPPTCTEGRFRPAVAAMQL